MSSPPEPSAAAPTPSAAAASQPPSSGPTGAAEATAVAPAPAPLPAAGGLSNWTVPQSSSQAQNPFLQQNRPKPSAQDRTRAPTHNLVNSAKKTRRSPGKNGTNNATTITPQERVRKFKNQGLIVSNGHVFCEPCGKQLSNDSDTIKTHCGLAKSRKEGSIILHEGNMSKWLERKGKSPDMLLRLEAWGKSNYGTTTSELTRSQRIEVRA